MAARPRRRRPDPGRAASGDRALGRARRGARLDDARRARSFAARGPRGATAAAQRRRGRARDGHPRRGQEPHRRARTSARGYVRLNRDERGGSLRELADALDEALASGARRVVLDNTYLTRAARSYVIDAAGRHGVAARCVWLDTPLAQAQVNLVERLLERFGSLADARRAAGARAARAGPARCRPRRCARSASSSRRRPTRASPPSSASRSSASRAGRRAPVSSSRPPRVDAVPRRAPLRRAAPRLRLEPDGDDLAAAAAARIDVAGPSRPRVCPHGGGPPACWCRPPLPGLPLAFARAHGVDPARSLLVGSWPAHRTLAATLGARFVAVGG